jgi:hypothetical protein
MSRPSKLILAAEVKLGIIRLNNSLPQEQASIWVTTSEMRDRLVHCGVDRSLTAEMISQVVRALNKEDVYLKVRKYNGANYYMPTQYFDEDITSLPNKQRFKDSMAGRGSRLNILPMRDYFLGSGDEQHRLDIHTVNNALRDLELLESKQSANCCVGTQTSSIETRCVGVQTYHPALLHCSDIARNKQPKAKARRSRQCMIKAVQMEKQERSKNKHKSGKLLMKHSGRSTKKKAVPRCGCCNQPGHTATKCPMPKKKKRKKMQLIDWITNDGSEDLTVGTGKKTEDRW